MDRDRLLDDVLRQVALQQGAEAVRSASGPHDPFAVGIAGFATFLSSGIPAVPEVDPPDASTALLLATQPVLREAKGCPGELPDLIGLARQVDATTRCGSFALYVAVEAALATARLDLAVRLRALAPDPATAWAGHPYAPVMTACAARTEIFAGNIGAALDLLHDEGAPGIPGALLRATKAVAAGNAADVATMQRLIAEVAAAGVAAVDHLGRGIHLLLAFGVIALGDTRAAVRHLLDAGGGADLEFLTVIDRVLGFELVVAAAVAEDDPVSAEAWLDRAERHAGDRAAAPTVHRIRCRVALLAGDAVTAESEAVAAVEAAAAESRMVERAEADILLARARIARSRVPAATRDLRRAVTTSDESGHHAVRLAAARALRPTRRRLPPQAGHRWNALSARERDVAELILAGLDNTAIAEELCLSPATVRAHATRVLTAFGVGTRIALLAATREAPAVPRAPGLTARQAEVAAGLAAGASNADLAAHLGISAKSVERHVSAILVRWEVRTRFELAHRWWAEQD